jgi:hypothetical protein
LRGPENEGRSIDGTMLVDGGSRHPDPAPQPRRGVEWAAVKWPVIAVYMYVAAVLLDGWLAVGAGFGCIYATIEAFARVLPRSGMHDHRQ